MEGKIWKDGVGVASPRAMVRGHGIQGRNISKQWTEQPQQQKSIKKDIP